MKAILGISAFEKKNTAINFHCIKAQFKDTKIRLHRASYYAFLIFLFFFMMQTPLPCYFVQYKEQYYKLYHVHYKQAPDEILENIYWLEQAIKADFCNPLYALTPIKNEKEWEKYRYIFLMHLNLKMTEQHLRLGLRYDKQAAYFYNYPWKEENIESLNTAKEFYNTALVYWEEAKLWAEKANVQGFKFLNLTSLQSWEDERERIVTGKLNYERTIKRELKRLENVKQTFLNMDENTY